VIYNSKNILHFFWEIELNFTIQIFQTKELAE